MYIFWYWNNFLNKKEVKNIVNFCDNNFEGYEDISKSAIDSQGNYKKSSTVKILYWKKLKNLLQNVNEMVIDCNYQNFGFDLNLLTDYQAVNYNSYSSKKNQKYDWHMDFDYKRPLLDTKLTLLINVSTKDYEGGEFQLNDGNVFTVSQFSKPGDMLLFRSHILHRVLPVTKGERKSLTIFFDGPKFR